MIQDQFVGLELALVKTDILVRELAARKLDATWHDTMTDENCINEVIFKAIFTTPSI
jgi:hypothetical protein